MHGQEIPIYSKVIIPTFSGGTGVGIDNTASRGFLATTWLSCYIYFRYMNHYWSTRHSHRIKNADGLFKALIARYRYMDPFVAFITVFRHSGHCKMVNGSLILQSAWKRQHGISFIYRSYHLPMPDPPSPSTLTVLNSNFLQLRTRSGGPATADSLPQAVYLTTVKHTALVGIEPTTFRSWVRRTTSCATETENRGFRLFLNCELFNNST